MNFPYYNVEFRKNYSTDFMLVTGEIRNYTSKDYSTAVFRIILYRKSKIMGLGMLKIFDFKSHHTRSFEAVLELNYKNIPRITGYDIVYESGF
jgi:hypothetical protein